MRSATARALRMVPASGSVDEFVETVAAHRQRAVRVLEVPLSPSDPSGLWLATDTNDWIVVPEECGPHQRMAIICHELSHILLGHAPLGSTGDREDLAALAAPHMDRTVAVRLLARQDYATDLESEAETLSTLLVGRLEQRADRARVMDDPVSDRLR